MTGIYFPGAELTPDDEKLRLLTLDKEDITVATAITRVMSKFYYDILPHEVAEYYVNTILEVAGEDFENPNLSLSDVMNTIFKESYARADEIEKEWIVQAYDNYDARRVFKNAMTDYVDTMSYNGYTATQIFGYDVIKDKFKEYIGFDKNNRVSDKVMDYMQESGYTEEYSKYYKTHAREIERISDTNSDIDNEKH